MLRSVPIKKKVDGNKKISQNIDESKWYQKKFFLNLDYLYYKILVAIS
jgi:hypothetical protein